MRDATLSRSEEEALNARLAEIPTAWRNPTRHYRRRIARSEGRLIDHLIAATPEGAIERVRHARAPLGQALLLNEYDALRKISHENVVSLRWAKRSYQQLFVTTSWTRSTGKKPMPIPLPLLLERMVGAARGASAIHDAGLIHGNLKPDTMRFAESRAVISDLELAEPPGKRKRASFTPKFAAPEQVLGEAVGPQADIYALGVTFYTLFIENRFPLLLRTGIPDLGGVKSAAQAEIPCLSASTSIESFRADSESSLLIMNAAETLIGAKIRFHSRLKHVLEAEPHAHLIGKVLDIVRRATHMDPGRRFQKASELADALAALLESLNER